MRYRQFGSEPVTVAMLEEFVRNQGDAWSLFTLEFSDYLERIAAYKGQTLPKEVGEAARSCS